MPSAKESPIPPELQSRLNALNSNSSTDDWKTIGNDLFSHGCYMSAIRCYTKALESDTDADSAVLRSNRSAAYLKSSMLAGPSLALKDAERAVALDPNWFKSHLRVGDAQFARRKYAEALAAYERVLQLDPACDAARASRALAAAQLDAPKAPAPREAAGREAQPAPTEAEVYAAQRKRAADGVEAVGRRIEAWSRETPSVAGRTAMRAFGATTGEADREAGVAYRTGLLAQYRRKLDTDTEYRSDAEARRETTMRQGEDVDYRNAERFHQVLLQGTNGIGMGISTDAYKSHKYESKMW